MIAALRDRDGERDERFELAGPQTLSHDDIVRGVLRSLRPRAPAAARAHAARLTRAARCSSGCSATRAFATWDEAELMEVAMISARGTADAGLLGVNPRAMSAVLGDRERGAA